MTMLPPDPLFVIRGDVSITCLVFSSNNKSLYSGNLSGDLQVWNLETYREVDRFSASSESLQWLNVMTQGKNDTTNTELLLIQDKMGCIALWTHDETWTRTWSVTVDYMGFCQARVLDDVLIVPLSSGGLQFFSLPLGEKLHTHPLWGRETSGELMAFVPFLRHDERFFLVASERGDVAVWPWSSSNTSSTTVTACGTALKLNECAMTLAFDARQMRGAAAGPGGTITTFNVSKEGNVTASRVLQLPCAGVAVLVLRPDSRILVAGGWDGKLRLYSWKSLVGLAVLAAHDASVQAATFSGQAPYLLAGGCKDGRISLWDLYNAR